MKLAVSNDAALAREAAGNRVHLARAGALPTGCISSVCISSVDDEHAATTATRTRPTPPVGRSPWVPTGIGPVLPLTSAHSLGLRTLA